MKIACLTQRKLKHFFWLQTAIFIDFQMLQLFKFKFAGLGKLHGAPSIFKVRF